MRWAVTLLRTPGTTALPPEFGVCDWLSTVRPNVSWRPLNRTSWMALPRAASAASARSVRVATSAMLWAGPAGLGGRPPRVKPTVTITASATARAVPDAVAA